MDEQKVHKLYDYLSKNWEGFNADYDSFYSKIQDENNLKKLHTNLSQKISGFSADYNSFKSELYDSKKKESAFRTVASPTQKPQYKYDPESEKNLPTMEVEEATQHAAKNAFEYIQSKGGQDAVLVKGLTFLTGLAEASRFPSTGGIKKEWKDAVDYYQRERAEQKESIAEYEPNTIETVGAFALSMFLDAPLFGALGKAGYVGGSKVLKGLKWVKGNFIKSGMTEEVANKAVSKTTQVFTDMFKASASSSTALGGYNAISDFATQLENHDIDDVSYGQILRSTGEGATIGAVLGPIGVSTKLLDNAISQKIASKFAKTITSGSIKVAGFETEVAAFSVLGASLSGEKVTAENFLMTNLQLGALKVGNIGNLRKSKEFVPEKENKEVFKVDFTNREKELLNYKDTDADAIITGIDAEKIMKDPDIPLLTKAKIMWSKYGVEVQGAYDPVKVDRIDTEDKNIVELRNEEGDLIDSQSYPTRDAARDASLMWQRVIERNDIVKKIYNLPTDEYSQLDKRVRTEVYEEGFADEGFKNVMENPWNRLTSKEKEKFGKLEKIVGEIETERVKKVEEVVAEEKKMDDEKIKGITENIKKEESLLDEAQKKKEKLKEEGKLVTPINEVIKEKESTVEELKNQIEEIKQPEKTEEIKTIITEEPQNAEAIRSDQGELPKEGVIPEGGKNKGGEDIQRQEEAGAKASDKALGLAAKSEKLKVLSNEKFGRQDILDMVQSIKETSLEGITDETQRKTIEKSSTDQTSKINKLFDEEDKILKESEKKLKRLEIYKDILTDFVVDNQTEFKKINPNAIHTLAVRIKNVNSWTNLTRAIDYMNGVMKEGQERENLGKIDKIMGKMSPEEKIKKKSGILKVIQPFFNRESGEHLKRLARITKNIEDGKNPLNNYDEKVYDVEERIKSLNEGKEDLKPMTDKDREINDYDEQMEKLIEEREELNFGRIWNMTGEELNHMLGVANEINRGGRSDARRNQMMTSGFNNDKRKFFNYYTGGRTDKTKKIGALRIIDADFPALMNRLGRDRPSTKELNWPWWFALQQDNVWLHIDKSKLNNEYKELYSSINGDVKNLLDNIRAEVKESVFADAINEEMKGVTKENVDRFIHRWERDLPKYAVRDIKRFQNIIENKYNDIYHNTDAWIKETFLTDPLQLLFHVGGIREAEVSNVKDMSAWVDKKNKALLDAFRPEKGITKDPKFKIRLENIRIPVETKIEYKNEYGELKNMRISQLEALQKYLEYQMPDAREKLMNESSLDKNGNVVGGNGWTENTYNQLVKFINPDVMELGKWIRKTYDEMGKYIQPAFLREYGLPLELRENYVATDVAPGMRVLSSNAVDQTDFVRGISSNRFKGRVPNKNALSYTDALHVLNGYVSDLTRFNNYSKPLRELESVFRYSGVRNTIKSRFGYPMLQNIDGFIDRFAGRHYRKNIFGATIPALENIMSDLNKGILFINTSVGAKQAISGIYFGAFMPLPEMTAGMTIMMSRVSPRGNAIRKLLKAQDFFLDRTGAARNIDVSINTDLDKYNYYEGRWGEAVRRYNVTKNKMKAYLPTETIDEIMGAFLQYGDKAPAIWCGGAFLNYIYPKFSGGKQLTEKTINDYMGGKENKALDRALKQWSVVAEGSLQSTRTSKVSNFRASGTIPRLLTWMTSGPAQNARNILMAGRNVIRGVNSYQNARAWAVNWAVAGALYGIFNNGFNLSKKGKKEIMWDIAIGSMKGLALNGRLLDLIYTTTTGKPWAEGVMGQTPMNSVVTKMMKNLKGLADDYDADKLTDEKKRKYVREIVTAYAQLNGINLKEGLEIYQHTKDLITDEDITWLEAFGLRTEYQQKEIDVIEGVGGKQPLKQPLKKPMKKPVKKPKK